MACLTAEILPQGEAKADDAIASRLYLLKYKEER